MALLGALCCSFLIEKAVDEVSHGIAENRLKPGLYIRKIKNGRIAYTIPNGVSLHPIKIPVDGKEMCAYLLVNEKTRLAILASKPYKKYPDLHIAEVNGPRGKGTVYILIDQNNTLRRDKLGNRTAYFVTKRRSR